MKQKLYLTILLAIVLIVLSYYVVTTRDQKQNTFTNLTAQENSAGNADFMTGDFDYWSGRGNLKQEDLTVFLAKVQDLVKNDDAISLSKLISYPLHYDGIDPIRNAADFVKKYTILFTPAMKARLLRTSADSAIYGDTALGLSNGALWVSSTDNNPYHFVISTINNDIPSIQTSSTSATLSYQTKNGAAITYYPNKEVMYAVNNQLKQEQYDLSCDAVDNPEALGWSSTMNSEVTYADRDIFSVHTTYEMDCGGAHPNAGDASVTFDLKTGKEIPLRALFKDITKNQAALGAIVKSAYSTEYERDSNEAVDFECVDSIDPSELAFATYFIDQGTLKIVPSLPHVVEACSEDIPIPLEKIEAFINQKSILSRLQN